MNKILLMLLAFFVLTPYFSLPASGGWEQKEFIITMWCPPAATDENLARLVSEGFTLTNVSWNGKDVRSTKAETLKMLGNADKYKIKTLVGNGYIPLLRPEALNDPVKKAELDEFIDTVKKHPSFEGYYLKDEPGADSFADWSRMIRYLKERDPGHLVYINLLPTYASQKQLGVFLQEPPKGTVSIPANYEGVATCKDIILLYDEYLKQYINLTKPELISYDHYFMRKDKERKQYFLNLELIRRASGQAGVPFLNIIQACSIEKAWRMPGKDELRWLAYTTMVYGGRGISWFLYDGPASFGGLYQDGKRMPAADWVAEINQEIKSLGPELMKLNSNQVYHSDPLPNGAQNMTASPVKATGGEYIVGMFKGNDGTDAFMIMNRDWKNKSVARVSISLGDGELFEFSISGGQWEKIKTVTSGCTIDVELLPSFGKLFKIRKS